MEAARSALRALLSGIGYGDAAADAAQDAADEDEDLYYFPQEVLSMLDGDDADGLPGLSRASDDWGHDGPIVASAIQIVERALAP